MHGINWALTHTIERIAKLTLTFGEARQLTADEVARLNRGLGEAAQALEPVLDLYRAAMRRYEERRAVAGGGSATGR